MQSKLVSESKSLFVSFIDSYRIKLYALARSRIPTQLQAQAGVSDVVQETCLRAFHHLSSFQGKTRQQFGSWLKSILKNQLANLIRRLRLQAGFYADPQQMHNHLACHDETPSHLLMEKEEIDLMNHAFERLSLEERHVLQRHHRDKYSFQQIGLELDCSEDAARKRWARAILRWKRLAQRSHV